MNESDMRNTSAPHVLTDQQIERYARHIALKEFGRKSQNRLLDSNALLVGAGGLGSVVALYLTAAGVGSLTIVDKDTVKLSDLQRQVLYGTSDTGHSKVHSAYQRLHELNPDVHLVMHRAEASAANVLDLVQNHDVVIDATDNLASRYLLNDACVLVGKPLVHGSVLRFQGQATVFSHHNGPCYRCVYPSPPRSGDLSTCQVEGVLNVVPGVIGLVEATEVIKLLIGQGDVLSGKMLLYDALRLRFEVVEINRDPTCAACGKEKPSM